MLFISYYIIIPVENDMLDPYVILFPILVAIDEQGHLTRVSLRGRPTVGEWWHWGRAVTAYPRHASVGWHPWLPPRTLPPDLRDMDPSLRWGDEGERRCLLLRLASEGWHPWPAR